MESALTNMVALREREREKKKERRKTETDTHQRRIETRSGRRENTTITSTVTKPFNTTRNMQSFFLSPVINGTQVIFFTNQTTFNPFT